MICNRRILSFLLSAVLLLALVVPGFAEENRISGSAVFINGAEEEDMPVSLLVTKRVQDADGNAMQTEMEFPFTFTVDGTPAREQAYTLLDGYYRPILLCIDVAGNAREYTEAEYDALTETERNALTVEPHRTDSLGNFMLKADQSAEFCDLPEQTRFTVQESCPEEFTLVKVTPENLETNLANGEVSGSLPPEGIQVEFTNRVKPEAPPPPPPGEPVSLYITKEIVPIAGFPAIVGEEQFRFQVLINGKPWAGKSYSIQDESNRVLDEGITTQKASEEDETLEGVVTLGGNQTAVLRGIDQYSAYTVTEVEIPDGWELVGTSVQSGNVQTQNVELTFRNRNAAFGVQKTMEDGSTPEEYFTFTINHYDKDTKQENPWEGAKFLRYDKDNKPVTGETEQTDNRGQFNLKPGQTVIFQGIGIGEYYSVRENAKAGYQRVIPANADEYAGKEVSTSDKVPIHLFQNKEQLHSLTVSKNVSAEAAGLAEGDMSAMQNMEFTFRLLRGNKPLTRQSYRVNGSDPLLTDKDGYFTLKHGQTAVFEGLQQGHYYVEESASSYNGMPFYPREGKVQDGNLGEDGLDFVFTNSINGLCSLELLKQDEKTEVPLAGAQFRLQKLDSSGNPDPGYPAYELVTDKDGKISVVGMWAGTYRLTETKAPDGYMILQEEIEFEINLAMDTPSLIFKNAVVYGSNTWHEEGSTMELTPGEDGLPTASLTVVNRQGIKLPESGGAGTTGYLFTGAMLMTMSLLALAWQRRKHS